jgi:hypothetical protein
LPPLLLSYRGREKKREGNKKKIKKTTYPVEKEKHLP